MAAEIDWANMRQVFPPETEWTFVTNEPHTPHPTKPHVSYQQTRKATGATREEALAKITLPEGVKVVSSMCNHREPDEECLNPEYIALIKARKEAGETDEQARILNRPNPTE